jgi:CheY-like chemotaxis protein
VINPIRVLLVEDNPGDARLLREVPRDIPNRRFDLVHVERLSEAIARLANEGFDMILLDLSLRDTQGPDTVARVRTRPSELPTVVITGLEDETTALNALQSCDMAQGYFISRRCRQIKSRAGCYRSRHV